MSEPRSHTEAGMTAAPSPSPGVSMDRRIATSRWRKLRRWLPIGVAGLGVCVATAAFELVPASGTLSVPAEEITSASAQEAPFQDYLPVRATVAPLHTVFVGAVEGGTVARVAVLDGASVKAGDMLATLSNPQLRLDVTSRGAAIAGQLGQISAQRLSLQQNLTTQDNAIAEASYNLLKAERELDIRRRLHEQGFESDAGVKSFEDETQYYTTRVSTLRQARIRDKAVSERQANEIDQTTARLKSNLDEVESSLDALVLRAPVDGRLTDFLMQPGQSLKQGDQIGQIDSEGAYRLDADIDEFYLGRVAEGEHAGADFDGTDARLTVSRVKPQVSNGQFRSELVFAGQPPAGLRRGESVEIRITLGQTRPALVLPAGPWLEGSGGSFAFVLDASGHHAVRRAIVSGRRNPEQVEIMSGLSAGDRVVTSSYGRFQNFSHLLVN